MKQLRGWTPNDWLRLIGLLGGMCLFGLGAWMLYQGISADGALDINSSLVSGKLKTSSAGLFVCFFSFVIIVFSLVSSLRIREEGSRDRLTQAFWGVFAALLACIAVSFTKAASGTAVFMGIGLLGTLFASLTAALIRRASDA